MKEKIREVPAFRLTIDRDKLARDEKCIRKIFEVLEECRIPCECMALNIDSLSTAIRKTEQEKLGRFIPMLERELGQVHISIEDNVMLLCVESEEIKGRRIGMIVSSLSMQNIEIKMQRYLRCRNLFVVCVAADAVEQARQIIIEAVPSIGPAAQHPPIP
ncbi:MAG: hypothetical protein NC548_48660 [Lachnospiraceae bacterium]|nr:hypothetical protein [Lachnospiraceae bacterium]